MTCAEQLFASTVNGMNDRELTIRVLGDFTSLEYALLAYEIGMRLRAAGLGDRTLVMADGRIIGLENDPE